MSVRQEHVFRSVTSQDVSYKDMKLCIMKSICTWEARSKIGHIYFIMRSYVHIFNSSTSIGWNRDSVVGIATSYVLDDRVVGVRVPVGSRIFTSPIVQTGSGAHPTSYTMGTWVSFLGVKRPGCEACHWPPTSAEVKKMWIYTSTLLYVLIAYNA
jgi:hypothetical protein